MGDLRQDLKDAGWRQGVILEPREGVLEHHGAAGFVVLNQTCDCISDDLANEPCFEVLPFSPLAADPDPQLINGRNGRRIHFQLSESGTPIWVRSRMADLKLAERSEHRKLNFSERFSMSPSCLKGLIAWRAARYLRPAFPDDLETAIAKPMKRKIGKIFKSHEDLIRSLLIRFDPPGELGDGECYELELRLMVAPEVFVDIEKIERLNLAAERIRDHLDAVPELDTPRCTVQSLAEMSLLEMESFFDFNRYDYLSFGEE